MRRYLLPGIGRATFTFSACILFVLLFTKETSAQNSTTPGYWIVKLASGQGAAIASRAAFQQRHYIVPGVNENHPAKDLVRLPFNAISEFDLQTQVAEGKVIYYERDAVGYGMGSGEAVEAPNDPGFSRQWYLDNDGTFSVFGIQPKAGADIKIREAWELEEGDSAVIVAILDTGINPEHKEFKNRLWKNTKEIAGNGIDDDKNGYIDDINGWNFLADNSTITDDGGHGTALAGVIAANVDNDFAYAGINRFCKLMICKVLAANQSGKYSDWVAGIYYAVEQGADVINMSVAGETDLRSLHEAIQYALKKGVLVICSMGNDNSDKPFYPAGYEETLAVGATDMNDERSIAFNGDISSGSNFGVAIDLVAPGNAIFGLDRFSNSVNTLWAGTSVSAAIVTGVASLLLSVKPGLTPGALKGLLMTTAVDQAGRPSEDIEGRDSYHGFGRVDAFQALKALEFQDSSEDPFKLAVFPNPTREMITCSVLLPSVSTVHFQLADPMGRIVMDNEFVPETPDLHFTIDLSGLAPAAYVLTLQQGHAVFRTRVLRN